ncbi:MAG TPA: sulfite exporter TauE/SafE family protein [Vicinamibacterales bacterium]|nr:sulfite exporter TauE/SafE family protein [Vicinamibacterales bacterium]
MITAFDAAVAAAGLAAGAIASVAGFGIGSILTPLLSLHLGTKLAVAAVSIPHVVGTGLRLWMLRGRIDRRTFLWFGLASAAGGLAGALLHADASNRALGVLLGCLLVFVGISGLSGLMERVRFGRRAAWIAGIVSGAFGGLVGNQGGIRSGALLAFDVDKEAFVATATAVGLIVDGARMPVYLAMEWNSLAAVWPLISIATAGVVAGTLGGRRVLARVPEATFRRVVAVLLLALGAWMIGHG